MISAVRQYDKIRNQCSVLPSEKKVNNKKSTRVRIVYITLLLLPGRDSSLSHGGRQCRHGQGCGGVLDSGSMEG